MTPHRRKAIIRRVHDLIVTFDTLLFLALVAGAAYLVAHGAGLVR